MLSFKELKMGEPLTILGCSPWSPHTPRGLHECSISFTPWRAIFFVCRKKGRNTTFGPWFLYPTPWDERYIFLDDWLICMVMYVGKYSIHGCYGYIINMTLDHVTNVAIDSNSRFWQGRSWTNIENVVVSDNLHQITNPISFPSRSWARDSAMTRPSKLGEVFVGWCWSLIDYLWLSQVSRTFGGQKIL